MVWCTHCDDDTETARDPDKGYVCCLSCGRIIDQDIYFSGPTFEKGAGGQSRLSGSILQSVQSGYSVSRERTLAKDTLKRRELLLELQIDALPKLLKILPLRNHHGCNDETKSVRDPDKRYICCLQCGRIIDQDIYLSGPTFEKTASGQNRLSGTIMHSMQSWFSVSRERTLAKGRDEIGDIVIHLRVGGGESIINQAHAFYRIAIEKNFTRGRRTAHVAAACLYIACRKMKKAYLLIDFSDYLQTNVYVLGAVFLQLCKVLSLDNHPIIQKLVDPSLFIHRFTERLLGQKNNAVSETALRIVASMKRDWMQTGRKPSGLCGAALYISALSHGLNYSKSDIVTVVHISEATLTKRLIEFENTESGCLTIDEFLVRADELDQESESNQLPRPGTVLCKHKDTEQPHFAHGLCRKCYNKFVKISGGLQGGAEPPAFQRAEKQRVEKAKSLEKTGESGVDMQPCHEEIGPVHNSQDSNLSSAVRSDATGYESQTSKGPKETGHHSDDTSAWDGIDNLYNTELGAEESLSDIDDVEVNGYLHSEEETHYKRIIWEEMNKEYLEEQAAKEAAAAAKEACDANIDGDDAIGGTGSKKPRKERKQRSAEDARNPAQTPAEATSRVLKRKGLSSKVNYDALGALYTSDKSTKKQYCSDADIADDQHPTIKGNEKDVESEGTEAVGEATTYEDAEYAGDEYGEHHGDDYGYNEDYDFEY